MGKTEDESIPPNIPRATVRELRHDGETEYEMNFFWRSISPWLVEKGIHLYDLRPDERLSNCQAPDMWHSPQVVSNGHGSVPFARCLQVEGEKLASKVVPICNIRLGFGQDSSGRDVVLKLVDIGSFEHQIYEKLLQNSAIFTDESTFPCVLPPLSILDTPHRYAIVCMPMWGEPLILDDIRSLRQALPFMLCTLRGLCFLHQQRIAHRDITDINMLVNVYRLDHDYTCHREALEEYRSGHNNDHILYALMDYDQAGYFPEAVSVRDFRRPAHEASAGDVTFRPLDATLGEPDYNPFAWDVGMLGHLFRFYFWQLVPMHPSLAVLYDAMTTHIVSERFTAEEALQFLSNEARYIPSDALDASHATYEAELGLGMHNAELYWSRLSPVLQARWECFRTPSRSVWARVLDRAMDYSPFCTFVFSFRRFLRI